MLVAIDLTPSADRVLRRVSLLPWADGARVTLLHVVPGGLARVEHRSAVREAERALVEEARHLRERLPGHVGIERLVKPGRAAAVIGACASSTKAQLIAIGRGGGSSVREAFLGSTTERVLRTARRPVLVVARAPRAPYTRPVLALDTDRAARDVVRLMLLLLPPPRPRVDVIHAFGVPYPNLIYGNRSEDEIDEMEEVFRRKATEELRELLTSALAAAGVPPEKASFLRTHVRYGPARAVVGRAIRRGEIDLLMLGSRGYSGVAYAFLGSVAGDLLRKAKCDVVVVPPTSSRR